MRKTASYRFPVWKLLFLLFYACNSSLSQQTNNTSTVTNSAAPAAAATTTGGTNINYQTNNAYNNENGFGPGIFCRTPTIQIGGTYGEAKLDAYDPIQRSGNENSNYSINAGMIIPFGSSVLEDCKRLVAAIARDREISSQLSMLRTCANLKKEGIIVDPEKFPMLAPCAEEEQVKTVTKDLSVSTTKPLKATQLGNKRTSINLKPKTNRLF